MKVYKVKPVFEPVIIKLETQEEFDNFIKMLSDNPSTIGHRLYVKLMSGFEFKSEVDDKMT